VSDVGAHLRTFIVEGLGWPGDPGDLTGDTPLLDGDVVDSVGVYELVTFLEAQYGIEILDEEVVPENFGTLSALTRLVAAKR
jgi:acyl carrier protein